VRPEIEMMLVCARTSVNSELADRIKFLSRSDIDWDMLLQTARQQYVLPLFYHSLHATCPEVVPKGTLEKLRRYSQTNHLQAFRLTRELLKVLDFFQKYELSIIPIKGPVLAASAYGDVSLRQYGDLDFLVDEQNYNRAQQLLRKQGFTQYESGLFMREEDQIAIDLQWRITDRYFPFLPPFASLWQRLVPIRLANRTVYCLSPEDTLLILCVHGSKHCWEILQWICDIAELLRAHPEIDWDYIIERAGELHCMRMLALGVRLARDTLTAPLPSYLLEDTFLADPVAKKLVPQIHGWLFGEPGGIPSRGSLERDRFFLNLRERFWDRILYSQQLARNAPPFRKSRWLLPLPALVSLCYYLLLPIWLVIKYALRPFITIEFDKLLFGSTDSPR
jgi:hypothetical protein